MPPTLLLNSLEGVRRRVRVLSVLYGLGIVLAAGVGLLLATVLLDYMMDLRPIPRIVLILAAVGGLGYAAKRWLLHPLLSKLKLTDVAGRIESAFPIFDDRLRSTIDFLTKGTPGSEVMKDRTVNQATVMATQVDLNNVVTSKPVMGSLTAGFGAVVLCIILASVISPDYLRSALSRLFTPFSGQPWPRRTEIDILSNVPTRVPVGQHIDLRIKLTKGDKPKAKVSLYCQYEKDGPISQEVMTRNADGTYTASLDARTEAGQSTGQMKVWMTSDDDRKDLPLVAVVEQLSIKDVEAVVTAPKYVTDAHPLTIDLSAAAGTVTVGSAVELRVAFNKALAAGGKAVSLEAAGKGAIAPNITWDAIPDGSSVAVGHFTAKDAVHFRVNAKDADGFTNTAIEEYQLLTRPDQPPTVQFEKPTRNEEYTPEAVVKLQALSEDDFGIKTMQLVVTRLGDKKSWTIDLVKDSGLVPNIDAQWQKLDSTSDHVRFRMNHNWDLSKVDTAPFKPGDQLEYYLQVQDTYQNELGFGHDPAFSESGHLRITIISQEELKRQIADIQDAKRNEIDEVRKANDNIKASTKSLQQDTQTKPALDRADKEQAKQLANDQSTAASKAEQIAASLTELQQRMADNKSPDAETAKQIAEAQKLLNNAAQDPMKGAADKLGEAKDQPADPKASPDQQKKDAADRNAALDAAQQKQAAASEQLQAAMDKMGSPTGVAAAMKEVARLLAAQQALSAKTQEKGAPMIGKDPKELTPEEKKTLDAINNEQKELKKDTEAAIKNMDAAGDKQSKSDPASSQALKQAAETGQKQNVAGNMGQAADSAQKNQQSSAQTAQKQAEIGLQTILQQLKAAEALKLAELIKQLDDAQKIIAELIQQQAGHNLDNLNLQGPAVMLAATKADADLIKTLFDAADRDAEKMPPAPPLETQIALQAQTESNTRHAVPVIQALPEGAEPSSHLTRAAQQMSRAVTYLQDKQLPDAYQPPQVEAINALLAAKKNIDDQMKKAQEKQQDEQKEAIRQKYIEIRDAQVKLNTASKTIDGGPHLADKTFDHVTNGQLGELATKQGDLSKRTSAMDDDLRGVGSIAYVYANDDIVKKMNTVSGALTKLDPGAKTQVTQTRIVNQLNDMIKDLAIKPKKKEPFDQAKSPGGSGSGGPPPPKLPTEAEIRLIQDMEKRLKEDTTGADADKADKASILELGKRQGDLRTLLDQVLQKASKGKVSLGPEPKNKDFLPEEATDEDMDLSDLAAKALDAKPDQKSIDGDTGMIGDRMARVRQRLSDNADPGKTTQRIEDRIILNLEQLAKMAQQQEAQSSPKPGKPGSGKPKPGEGPPQPGDQPGNSVANGQKSAGGKSQGAGTTAATGGEGPPPGGTDMSADPAVLLNAWAKMSPRDRAAVMEGNTDQTIGKFRDFVDGYYRTLAQKAAQQ